MRIVLHEKRLRWASIGIDLAARPSWLSLMNPTSKVPVWRESGWVLPESTVIMEYLEEAYRLPPLLPHEPRERAEVRLFIYQHGDRLADDYYAFRRDGEVGPLTRRLDELGEVISSRDYLVGRGYSLADIAYLPWVVRAERLFGVQLPDPLAAWVERLAGRDAVRAEIDVVERFARLGFPTGHPPEHGKGG